MKYCDGVSGPIASGSGTVVGDGLVLTNFHVVRNFAFTSQQRASRSDLPPKCVGAVTVQSGTDEIRDADEEREAEVVAVDAGHDLAVLRVSGLTAPVIPLADAGSVKTGEAIRILGYPGLGGDSLTVSDGVISGLLEGKPNPIFTAGNWYKTDAFISAGNSGGGAFDADGALVGVPTGGTRGALGENLSWLVSVEHARPLIASAATGVPINPGDPKLDESQLPDRDPSDGNEDPPPDEDAAPGEPVLRLLRIVGTVGGKEVNADPDLPSGVTKLDFVVLIGLDESTKLECRLTGPSGIDYDCSDNVGRTDLKPYSIGITMRSGATFPNGEYRIELGFENDDASADADFKIG
jgi:hypothetical protein